MVEKQFSREELEIMKWDWIHCQNVQQVAELHACGKKDVINALGLDEKPRPKRKRRWEELHPAKAQAPLGGIAPGQGAAVCEAGGKRRIHGKSKPRSRDTERPYRLCRV